MTSTAAPAPDRALTNADRCDRCGAQAFIRVVLEGGRDLLFCAHHGKQHEDRLRTVSVQYVDESERLRELATRSDAR